MSRLSGLGNSSRGNLVIAVVAVAPCQCFTPGGNQTTSPGRISSTDPPSRCAQPQPLVTIRVGPSGWVCHAVRAPGSKVTLAPAARPGSGASNSGSTRTVPVNHSQSVPGDARRTAADTRLASDLLGYRPEVDLADGLRQEIEWIEALLEEERRDALVQDSESERTFSPA